MKKEDNVYLITIVDSPKTCLKQYYCGRNGNGEAVFRNEYFISKMKEEGPTLTDPEKYTYSPYPYKSKKSATRAIKNLFRQQMKFIQEYYIDLHGITVEEMPREEYMEYLYVEVPKWNFIS